MAKYYKNYKKNNYGKKFKKNYNNQNYSSMKPWFKRINWTPLIALLLAITSFAGLYVVTNGFYAEHLMVWDTEKAWYCASDFTVYTDNDNALITKDAYLVKKDNKNLSITINCDTVPVVDRSSVRYSVIYYSGEDIVYQSSVITPEYDMLTNESSEKVLFSFSDIELNGPYYAKILSDEGLLVDDISKERAVDSVRVAVLYLGEDRVISFNQQRLFTEAIKVEYVS